MHAKKKKKFIDEPWYPNYLHYIDAFDMQTRFEKRLACRIAKKQYKMQESSGLKKKFYQATNWFVATAFAGQMADGPASKLEKITKVPKKHAQDWNVLWSSWDHITLIYGAMQSMKYADELPEFVSSTAENSLSVTVPFAIVCTAWGLYRLANRDDKARMSLGYGSIVTHAVYYAKTGNKELSDYVNQHSMQAKKEGVSPVYSFTKTVLSDAYSGFKQNGKHLLWLFGVYSQK
jgi:hypothetical protein